MTTPPIAPVLLSDAECDALVDAAGNLAVDLHAVTRRHGDDPYPPRPMHLMDDAGEFLVKLITLIEQLRSRPDPAQSEPKGVPVAWQHLNDAGEPTEWCDLSPPSSAKRFRLLYAAPPATPDKVSGDKRKTAFEQEQLKFQQETRYTSMLTRSIAVLLKAIYDSGGEIGPNHPAVLAANRAINEPVNCAAPPASAESAAVEGVGPELCPLCKGTGDGRYGPDGYSCGVCKGSGYAAPAAGSPAAGERTCDEVHPGCLGFTNGCHCKACMGPLSGGYRRSPPTPDDGRSRSDGEMVRFRFSTTGAIIQDAAGPWVGYDQAAARLRELLDENARLTRERDDEWGNQLTSLSKENALLTADLAAFKKSAGGNWMAAQDAESRLALAVGLLQELVDCENDDPHGHTAPEQWVAAFDAARTFIAPAKTGSGT